MNEQTIEEVRLIIENWNPLGEQANFINDLDGYKYEASDIIFAHSVMPGKKLETIIKDIIEQAFKIKVNKSDLEIASSKISEVFNSRKL